MPNRGRLSQNNLEELIEMARPILIEVAKEGECITYKQLMDRMGGRPGRGYIGEVIGRICEIEHEARRPKLAALVVRAETGMVSGGFFSTPGTPENIKRSTPEECQNPGLNAADQAYWRSELEKLYKYWQKHNF